MKVVKEFDNKLLHRKEVEATLDVEGSTPSRAEVKTQLAKATKAKEELIVVSNIKSTFGERSVKVFAYVYENEEMLKRITPDHIQKRNATAQKAVAEE